MNTSQNTSENASTEQGRPFGFWITAVDRLLAAEFATAFEDEGITRRDWRILNVVDGTVPRGPKTAGRPLPEHKLRRLADLGWVERGADGWALTTDGTAAKARLRTAVEEIRAQVAGSLDPEEFAAMAASLEKLARGLGYEEGKRLPRRPGVQGDDRRRGHHRDHDRRFGHGAHRHEADYGHGEQFGHGAHRREADFGHGERFDHGEWIARGERPGFGRERLQREHLRHEHRCGGRDGDRLHGEHGRGMSPRGGLHRHAAPHIHVHLHDGRRDG